MFVDLATKNRLKEKYGNETVFVVPSSLMKHIPDKFSINTKESRPLISYDNIGRYVLRSDAEMNMAFQQLIPYVIIKNRKGDKYFVAKRIAGDDRLKNTLSIGQHQGPAA